MRAPNGGSWTRRTRFARWRTTCRATASRPSRACRRSRAARSGLFGYDLVRTVERLPEPNPDDIGTPDMALMVSDALVVFDHLSHQVTILVNAFVDDPDEVDEAYAQAAALIERARELLAEPVPRPAETGPRPADPASAFESNMTQAEYEAAVERARGLHLRGRRLPGRAVTALERAVSGRGLLDLPRPARREPVALHVLPRVGRLRDRGRVAGAAGEGDRPPRRDAADRRYPPAGVEPRGGPAPWRTSCWATRRSAPST